MNLQIEDLRVGNYLYNDGVIVKIDARTIFDIWDNNGLKKYAPIPITEELLLKCGCIKQQITIHKYNYWHKEQDFSVDIEHINKTDKLYFYLINNQLRRKHFIYFHQLQNIQRALKETNLTINL